MKKMNKNDILMCTTAVFGVTAVTFAILFGWKSCNSSPKAELFMNMIYHYKSNPSAPSLDYKKVAIKYTGSVAKVDWGDGVVEEKDKITPDILVHTYGSIDYTKDYSIAIYGTPISITISNKEQECLLEAGNLGIREIKLTTKSTSIAPYQFAYCDGLELVNIPSTVAHVEHHAFYHCSNLKEVRITTTSSHKLSIIGERAFEGCKSLKYFAIPEELINLEPYTFKDCENMERFTFPRYAKLKAIKQGAFYNCSKLINFHDFPTSTLTEIADEAFLNCSALKDDLYIPSSVTTTGQSIFSNAGDSSFKLHVPFKEYEEPAGWNSSWRVGFERTIIYQK